MKPLRIEFAAFGSYPGEVSVDFTALAARGLFVVTGDTGTGKTTIFDAMSFALFGDMPLKPGHDIRSHHAESSQPTYARFRFSVDGVEYVAERFPEQERPALRGGGVTTEKPKASLVRVDAAGGTTSLATRVSDMKRAVAEVVGLDAEQFRRVMLLPQGEVARFLLDDSTDREGLLSALFGGAVYDRIAGALQAEASRLRTQVAAADEALRHHLANARGHLNQLGELLGCFEEVADDVEREFLDEFRDACEPALVTLRADSEAADALAAARSRALTEGQHAANRFTDALEARAALEVLDAASVEVEAEALAAEASRRARPVVTAAGRQAERTTAFDEASEAVKLTCLRLGDLAEQHQVPLRTEPTAALNDDVEALAVTVRDHMWLLDAVAAAETELRRLEDEVAENREAQTAAQTTVKSETDRLEAIDLRVDALQGARDELAAVDADTLRLQAALEQVELRDRAAGDLMTCVDTVVLAERHHETVLRRFVETTAPRLAAQLVPGEPCAVCGSVEHPAPAAIDHGDPVDLDAVAEAQAALDVARQSVSDTEARVAQARTRLGEWADVGAEELRVLVEALGVRRQAAQADCDELGGLVAERVEVERRWQEAKSELDRLDGVLEVGASRVADLRDVLAAAEVAAAGVEPARVELLTEVLRQLRSLAADLSAQRSDAAAARSAVELATESLGEALAASGFADVSTAEGAVMEESRERGAMQRRDDHRSQRQHLEGRLLELQRQGIPEVAPDVEALAEAASTAERQSRELAKRRTLADQAASDLASELARYDTVGAGSQDLRRRAQLTERAQLVCRGQVGPRVSLRRWVLGQELDRVVAAASVHLSQMTSGRYSIRRALDMVGGRSARGLDLEVLDAHTGRARSPRTLSGGEQFQASLALALGLADVVSQGGAGSGRRIEALFVDEGFGSLDPRALDDAIETLHQLHATGRMVGAITHVEAMKERLHPGIIVTRLPDGKGSTLRVNP